MSRCFPFPPPGYEKEARSREAEDLLKKEKRKEKKHKKEKREKEKSESKERKDKDRSRDKHKERKERKERHKDKSKDKERDKAKSRTLEDTRTEIWHEIRQDIKFGYDCETEEVRNSKFDEELGRRIRDAERGAAGPSVGNSTTTTERRLEAVDVSTAVEKESSNKMVSDFIGMAPGRNENLPRPIEKRSEGISTGFASANQRVTSSQAVLDFTSTERGKNHIKGRQVDNFTSPHQSRTGGTVTTNSLQEGRCESNSITGQLINNFMGSAQRKSEGTFSSNPIHKEKPGSNHVTSSVQKSTFVANSMQKESGANINTDSDFAGAAQRKNNQNLPSSIQRSTEKERVKDSDISVHKQRCTSNDVHSNFLGASQSINGRTDQQVGNLMPPIQRNAEGVGIAPKMEKEAVRNSDMVPYTIGTEQKTDDRSSAKKKERKEKSKEKKTKEGKGEECKDRDWSEKKSKRKDKDRHKEKEKEEKMRDGSDDKKHKHGEAEEIKRMNQVDTITKPLAPPAEIPNTIAADGNSKKRKATTINGFVHETDWWPNKLPRTGALENGKVLNLTSITLNTINNLKVVSDSKETKLNGKAEARPSSVMPGSGESGKVSSKLSSRQPHPDAMYLSTVYSVPKHTELPESDDQDWLFASKDLKMSTKLGDDAVLPQVWARGLQIESSDVFALPYVVPF